MMMSLFSSVRYGNRNPRFGNKILAGGGTVGHSGVLWGAAWYCVQLGATVGGRKLSKTSATNTLSQQCSSKPPPRSICDIFWT